MRRKLCVVAVIIVALHLLQELFVGVTPFGSLIANSLQIFSALIAVGMCVVAGRRAAGSTRLFWFLIASSFLVWGIADLGWVYYETFRHIEPPRDSIVHFLVDTRSLFLVMALILDQKGSDSYDFDVAPLLDLAQLAIIYALIYLGWYYVPSLSDNNRISLWRSAKIEVGEDFAVLGLAYLQAWRARTSQIRSLYLQFALYFTVLTAGVVLTDYEELVRAKEIPTGTWLDLWWTVPYLGAAWWAAGWRPGSGFYPALAKEKSFPSILFEKATFALAPLVVLLQVAELGPGWRRLSFSLLGVSILCFATRLALSEFRESHSALIAHRADQERLEAESKFRIAFQANPESITITTLDNGMYLEVNDAFVATIGYQRAELIGRSAVDLNIWVEEKDRIPIIEKLRRGERVNDSEVRFRTKSGQQKQLMLSSHPVQLQGQLCLLSILHDVTEKRLLEQRVHQAQKMEAVGRLAGGVAHDFNNLLMITSANAELLEKAKNNPDTVGRYANQIQSATERGAALTRQMLAFSRQQILTPSVLNLNSVITDLWKILPRLLGEDIETVLSLDPDLGHVNADRGQLEQVIMNLSVNARDAMPQGGKLIVETSNIEIDGATATTHSPDTPAGPYVLLGVTDNGSGMTPAVQAQVFDPFFTTKELGKGTGLGLATVYGIVRQSGGSISVYSEIGRGSTFKVYLPRVQEKVQETEGALPVEPVPLGSGTILLVEDETALRTVTSEYLRARGYQVLEAANGDAALEICKAHASPIDLLITDIVMPGRSGPMVAREVAGMRPTVRTIFMSGYTDRTLRPDVLGPNAAFFQKPFNLEALARKIHTMLNNQR